MVFMSVDREKSNGRLVRALWVTRFDYSSPEDVRRIIENVAKAGFTDLFFQVRGNGTTFYKSEVEPWAHELLDNNISMLGQDPGWDPLQLAIDIARPHELRVHAYINALTGWKGCQDPPARASQLWTAHPDWFMVDSLGDKMLPTSGWYAFINPVLPQVRQHLRSIAKELCQYDIAGIHLDYIRYPYDYYLVARQRYPEASEQELRRRSDFSYDAVTQSVLLEKFGRDVSRSEILSFRRDSVTKVVRDFSYVMQMERPGSCLLSASVLGNPIEGYRYAHQDSGAWVREGIVDWAVQMNYGVRTFDRNLAAMKKSTGKKGFSNQVVVGLNCENSLEDIVLQMETVKKYNGRGIAFFSYRFFFDEEHRETKKGRKILSKLRS
ncbi:MAG TPA: family 10 glycosylhydrolase [Pontiella sp.]